MHCFRSLLYMTNTLKKNTKLKQLWGFSKLLGATVTTHPENIKKKIYKWTKKSRKYSAIVRAVQPTLIRAPGDVCIKAAAEVCHQINATWKHTADACNHTIETYTKDHMWVSSTLWGEGGLYVWRHQDVKTICCSRYNHSWNLGMPMKFFQVFLTLFKVKAQMI